MILTWGPNLLLLLLLTIIEHILYLRVKPTVFSFFWELAFGSSLEDHGIMIRSILCLLVLLCLIQMWDRGVVTWPDNRFSCSLLLMHLLYGLVWDDIHSRLLHLWLLTSRFCILIYQLTAVLFITEPHRPCLICKCVEQFSNRLFISHRFHRKLALGDKEFELFFLLSSDSV